MTTAIYEQWQCFDGECVPRSKYVCSTCPLYPASKGDVYLQSIREQMAYPKMEVFFVINGTTPVKAFRRNGLNKFLMSAYSIKYQQAGSSGTLGLLKGTEWILDSGMISAWRNGRTEWMNNQDYLVSLAKEMHPTFVSHLDVPVEKHLLQANHMGRKDAVKITIRNAQTFLDAKVEPSKKIFSLQGWTLDEYLGCLHEFRDLGIMDYLEKQGGRLGIGTMCLRQPGQGLYGILQKLRKEISLPIHVWGVGQLSYQKRLSQIGIDSTDTGSVLMQWAFSERRLNSQKESKGQTRLEGMT